MKAVWTITYPVEVSLAAIESLMRDGIAPTPEAIESECAALAAAAVLA